MLNRTAMLSVIKRAGLIFYSPLFSSEYSRDFEVCFSAVTGRETINEKEEASHPLVL
jgi:hypothetical protein